MSSARDHEKKLTQFFRDNPQIRNALKSGRDATDHGVASSGCTWEEWAEATSMQQVELLRAKAKKNALYTTRKYKQLRMGRYAVLASAVVLIIFLSAVPTGRAFADAALHNATSLVDSLFYMQSKPINDITVDEGAVPAAQPVTDLDKVKKAARYVDETLLYMKAPGLAISDVSVTSEGVTDSIKIEYTTADDQSITTYQDIMQSEGGWGATIDTNGEAPKSHVLYNGEILYYGYTHEGFAIGLAHWGSTSFMVSSTTLKWEEMLKYVDALALVE